MTLVTLATLQTEPGDVSEFVAVQGGQDTVSAMSLLVAAYLVMWAVLLGSIWLTARRQKAVDQRLQQLEAALQSAEDKADSEESQ